MAMHPEPPGIPMVPEGAPLAPKRLSFGAILMLALALALAWHERTRQRRRLMQLHDCVLDDIGVGRAEAERECRNPFWRPFWPSAMDL